MGNNLTAAEAREKIKTYQESSQFQKYFDVGFTQLKTQILHNKIYY